MTITNRRGFLIFCAVAFLTASGILYAREVAITGAYTFGRLFGDRSVSLGSRHVELPKDAWIVVSKPDGAAIGFIRGFGDAGLIHVYHKPGDSTDVLRRPTAQGAEISAIDEIEIAGHRCNRATYFRKGATWESATHCPDLEVLMVVSADEAWVWNRAADLHFMP